MAVIGGLPSTGGSARRSPETSMVVLTLVLPGA